MEYFEIGCCFKSYEELTEKLKQYCSETYAKFTTKDCRLIKDEFVENTEPKSRLIYTDLKLICVHGRTVKQKNPNAKRKRTEKNVQTGCPAYFRLKLIHSGVALQIVALNIKHNHPLEPPKEKELIASGKRGRKAKIPKTKADKKFNDEIKSEEESGTDNDQEFVEGDGIDEPDICFDLKGLCVPVFTPFSDDTTVNSEAIHKYAKYLESNNITAILVNSSMGEASSLTVAERELVLETWQEAVKPTRQHLMVQIGGCPLKDSLELARYAEKLKVDSLICLPETDSQSETTEDMVEYLRNISEAAPRTPLLYHHDPSVTGVNKTESLNEFLLQVNDDENVLWVETDASKVELKVDMKRFLEDAMDKVRTFKGINYCSSDLDLIVDVLIDENRKCSVFFGGTEKLLTGAFALGFDSAIVPLANLFPDSCTGVLKSINESDLTKARTIQRKLTEARSQIEKYGNIPAMKSLMNLFSNVDVGSPRPPLNVLTEGQLNEIKQQMSCESNILE